MRSDRFFILIFLSILSVDIALNNTPYLFDYRYITKPFVIFSLIVYFSFNSLALSNRVRAYVFAALVFLFIGDFFILQDTEMLFLALGMISFICAKIMYALAFSYRKRHTFKRAIPYLIFAFAYCTILLYFIINSIGKLWLPVTAYMLATLYMIKMAYLRHRKVNNLSFYLVMIGCALFLMGETVSAINRYYTPLAHKNVTIMLCYALGQLFIIKGVISEVRKVSK